MSLSIVEGIAGMWHYHLSDGPPHTAICGALTMATGCRLDSWGFKPDHMPTSYCKTCESMKRADIVSAGGHVREIQP